MAYDINYQPKRPIGNKGSKFSWKPQAKTTIVKNDLPMAPATTNHGNDNDNKIEVPREPSKSGLAKKIKNVVLAGSALIILSASAYSVYYTREPEPSDSQTHRARIERQQAHRAFATEINTILREKYGSRYGLTSKMESENIIKMCKELDLDNPSKDILNSTRYVSVIVGDLITEKRNIHLNPDRGVFQLIVFYGPRDRPKDVTLATFSESKLEDFKNNNLEYLQKKEE